MKDGDLVVLRLGTSNVIAVGEVVGQRREVTGLDVAGHQTGLRVVDDVGRIAALEADVDLGLELVGALPDDLDAGALHQRVVAGDELLDDDRIGLNIIRVAREAGVWSLPLK